MRSGLRAWPPYIVALLLFLSMMLAYGAVADLALEAAIMRGTLDHMPSASEIDSALDVAFGSPAKKLAVGIALNALLAAGAALLAAGTDAGPRVAPVVIRRLSLEPPHLFTLGIAVLGLVGVTTMLDSIVGLLNLRDFGTLASMRDAVAHLGIGQKIVFALLIGIGPGVTEELFFRGYFLNRVAAARGTTAALVSSSILFGLFHVDPVHSVLAAVMGLYLGVCLLHSRSLWVPIAAHTANNSMATLTADWVVSDVQAILLIPLGGIAGVSAVVLLSRHGRALPRVTGVW